MIIRFKDTMAARILTISVNDIKFDPEDEITPQLKKDSIVYYFYLNKDMLGQSSLQNGYQSLQIQLSSKVLNDASNVVRIIAKDHSLTVEGGEFMQVGTISINCEHYLKSFPDNNLGKQFTQWITLFDDTEDDEFDGELAEDDEELPMVRASLKIDKQTAPVTRAMASPRRTTVAAASARPTDMTSPAKIPTGLATLGSPVGNPQKRKTVVVTDTGMKKLINTNELLDFQEQQKKGKANTRRNVKKDKISDVFGDFFGFGPNPPGCLAKGAPEVNFKAEKEKFLGLLRNESKQYDIEAIKVDLNNKQIQISQQIRKEQKNMTVGEERQLRNIDKLDYMFQYLKEDNVSTNQSLLKAQQIRDESNNEMQTFQAANVTEMEQLAKQIAQMEELIRQSEQKLRAVEQESVAVAV